MKHRLSDTLTFITVALIIAIIVTTLVYVFSPAKLGDWLRTLSATSISALFAVAIGVGLFNLQAKATGERRRQQLIEVLKAEITDIRDELADNSAEAYTPITTESGNFRTVLLPQEFQLVAMDETIRSGLFSTSIVKELINLSAAIRMYNRRVENAQALIQADILDARKVRESGAGHVLDANVDNLEQHRRRLIELCAHMLTHLQGYASR